MKHDEREKLFSIIRKSMKELETKRYSREDLGNIFLPEAQACYYCNQKDLYEIGRNHRMQFSMMECNSCDKTYMVEWNKKDEVRKYNIILPRE